MLHNVESESKREKEIHTWSYGSFSRILFSQTDNCAPTTISFLLFHSFLLYIGQY